MRREGPRKQVALSRESEALRLWEVEFLEFRWVPWCSASAPL